MDFARKQLEKYGWQEGKGLGLKENGIAEALKPKIKLDTAGVGHNPAEQFTNNWWDRLFNDASNNLNVSNREDGVQLALNSPDSVEISTKNYSVKQLKKNKHLCYGSFLKTSKLTESGVEDYKVKLPEMLPAPPMLTDDELFAACNGRTAHKAARHGLKLSGKLSRIEKQEKILLKKMKNVSLLDDTANKSHEKKMKKLKKHAKELTADVVPEEEVCSPSTKKFKNKRKSVSFSEQPVVKYYTPDKDENSNNTTVTDEGIEQDIDGIHIDLNDTHRSFEEAQKSFDDLSKAEKKKLKKKRKLAKKLNATNLFIGEVRQEIADDTSKKRKYVLDEKQMDLKCGHTSKYSKKKKGDKVGQSPMVISIAESLGTACKITDDDA